MKQLSHERHQLIVRGCDYLARKHHYRNVMWARYLRQLMAHNFIQAPANAITPYRRLVYFFTHNNRKPRVFPTWIRHRLNGDEPRTNRLTVLKDITQASMTMKPMRHRQHNVTSIAPQIKKTPPRRRCFTVIRQLVLRGRGYGVA